MTEQFMENISNEEHERLLLLCGHGVGPSLSPAARAIVDAWENEWSKGSLCHNQRSIAAVLRAAADQVVPWKPEPTEESVGSTIDFGYAWALFSKANDVRQELLAIAAELEDR